MKQRARNSFPSKHIQLTLEIKLKTMTRGATKGARRMKQNLLFRTGGSFSSIAPHGPSVWDSIDLDFQSPPWGTSPVFSSRRWVLIGNGPSELNLGKFRFFPSPFRYPTNALR